MQKKFIVTGGAGFIGSAVARKLIQDTPHHVLVLDKLTYAGNLDSLAPIASDRRYRFEHSDICDGDRVGEILSDYQPDVILHLAAETHVDRSIDGPTQFIQTNVVGTLTLLEAALSYWRNLAPGRRDRFRFHHVSTDEVFGSLGTTGSFTRAIRISRIHPIRPRKLVRTILSVPGTTPMDFPPSSRIVPTIMGRITSPRNSFRW